MHRGAIALLFSFFAATSSAFGQSEQALRAFFEGKMVRVKIDMPGTNDGIDIFTDRQPALDFGRYSQRIKRFPKAILDGDNVRITTIRVRKKNLEIHFNGGGFGSWGDSNSGTTLPTISRTSRESELERNIKKETDPSRRDQMSRELDSLRRERRRQESNRAARQAELDVLNREENLRRQRDGGSRFNIWYPESYLKESIPTPEQVIEVLAEYVDFGDLQRKTAPAPTRTALPSRPVPNTAAPINAAPPAPTSTAVANYARLRTGQRRDEVRAIMGKPKTSRKRNEGSLVVETDIFEDRATITEVDFTNSVAIQFRVTDK